MKCNRHTKLRIDSWCKRLCQIIDNECWKKNRNLHAIYLLNMIINNIYEDPYNKFPSSAPIPFLSRPLVKSKLTKKFWKTTQNIFETTLKEDFIHFDNKKLKEAFTDEKNKGNIINDINEYQLKNSSNNKYLDMYKDDALDNDNLDIDLKNNKISELDEKKLLFEKCKALKLKNDNLDKIIIQQEEENTTLINRINELEKILKTQIKLNDIK